MQKLTAGKEGVPLSERGWRTAAVPSSRLLAGPGMMAGQSVGLISDILPMREIVQRLVREAEEELQRIRERVNR